MVKYCCQMLLVLAILGAATSALTGCGQKGPLYLPGETISEQQQLEAELEAVEREAQEEVLGPQDLGRDSGSLIPSRSP